MLFLQKMYTNAPIAVMKAQHYLKKIQNTINEKYSDDTGPLCRYPFPGEADAEAR
jgi:hypothetical protein